jgi:hypothetical protein
MDQLDLSTKMILWRWQSLKIWSKYSVFRWRWNSVKIHSTNWIFRQKRTFGDEFRWKFDRPIRSFDKIGPLAMKSTSVIWARKQDRRVARDPFLLGLPYSLCARDCVCRHGRLGRSCVGKFSRIQVRTLQKVLDSVIECNSNVLYRIKTKKMLQYGLARITEKNKRCGNNVCTS